MSMTHFVGLRPEPTRLWRCVVRGVLCVLHDWCTLPCAQQSLPATLRTFPSKTRGASSASTAALEQTAADGCKGAFRPVDLLAMYLFRHRLVSTPASIMGHPSRQR